MSKTVNLIAQEMRRVADMVEHNTEPTMGAKTAKQTRDVERSLRAYELRKYADRIEEAEKHTCPCMRAFMDIIAVLEKWRDFDLPPMRFNVSRYVIEPAPEDTWLTLLRQVQCDCRTALENLP